MNGGSLADWIFVGVVVVGMALMLWSTREKQAPASLDEVLAALARANAKLDKLLAPKDPLAKAGPWQPIPPPPIDTCGIYVSAKLKERTERKSADAPARPAPPKAKRPRKRSRAK